MLRLVFDAVRRDRESLMMGLDPSRQQWLVQTYWFPFLLSLEPERLEPVDLASPDLESGPPFVYPVELGVDAIDLCRNPAAREIQLVILPDPVLRAAAAGRALILVFLAHEGIPLGPDGDGEGPCIFDQLASLAHCYGLAPHQLWFVTGGLLVEEEVHHWEALRGVTRAFTVRACEPFSFIVGRLVGEGLSGRQGPHIATAWGAQGALAARVTWIEDEPAVLPPGSDDWPEITYRYACLNRSFRVHRWRVVESLYRAGLLDEGFVSFPAVGTNEAAMIVEEGCRFDEIGPLLTRLPMVADRSWTAKDGSVEAFQQFVDENLAAGFHVTREVGRHCAMEIVTEALQDRSRFVTEKSFKTLAGRGPSVLVGCHGSLGYLHSIGVETWPELLDESYDSFGDPWDPATAPERVDRALAAAYSLIRDPAALARADRASRPIRERNLRWLIEAEKPWERFVGELERAVEDM